MAWFGRRTHHALEEERAVRASDAAPTIVARFDDGPLKGGRTDVEAVEGRPPKIVEIAADGGRCRYCLAGWTQTGNSATYTFLYRC